VRAHHALSYDNVKKVTEALERYRIAGRIGKVFAEVREGE
jgi:hypothetical protein